MKGQFIVFEGIDGSGKNTQTNMLFNYLSQKNISAKKIHFPAYDKTFFGKEVGKFLNGDFGSLGSVHPKLAAILYAGDRFEMKPNIAQALEENEFLLCDRYVASNIAHQGAKIISKIERENFKLWVEKLEFSIFNLPRPDLVFFLDLPPKFSSQLVLKKAERAYTHKKEDIHERDRGYLIEVFNYYKEISDRDKWININCYDKKKNLLRSKNDISAEIAKIILGTFQREKKS